MTRSLVNAPTHTAQCRHIIYTTLFIEETIDYAAVPNPCIQPFKPKIGTPVAPAPENVHINFGSYMLFTFLFKLRARM